MNTPVLELVNQMTAKDEREKAWKGAVVRSSKLNRIKNMDLNRVACILQIYALLPLRCERLLALQNAFRDAAA
jgi:hypothetical protein